MDALENTHRLMNEAMARAKKADRLNKSWTAKLTSFPLLCRIFSFRRFKGMRKRIKSQEWERFACTSAALNLSRRIKFHTRRQKQLEDERRRRNNSQGL